MSGRAVAWIAYVPIPGLFLIPLYTQQGDRLARFHAKQGGLLVGTWYVLVVLAGFLATATGPNPAVATLVALVLVAGILGMGLGIVASARARFVRIRPIWDLLSAAGSRRTRPQ